MCSLRGLHRNASFVDCDLEHWLTQTNAIPKDRGECARWCIATGADARRVDLLGCRGEMQQVPGRQFRRRSATGALDTSTKRDFDALRLIESLDCVGDGDVVRLIAEFGE